MSICCWRINWLTERSIDEFLEHIQTLVEMGEMLLSDGRRIVPKHHPLASSTAGDVIVSHPDFRMIVLANRPGFPFLGNDFFGALGKRREKLKPSEGEFGIAPI